MPKKIVSVLFFAMLVFTGITAVMAIAGYNANKNRITIDPAEVSLVQLETIKGNIPDDADVAIISTSLGEIRAQLYTEYAPVTVAKFKELAQSGYYDETFFYDVQPGLYCSGGSPYIDGSLEDNYDKESEKIEPELNKDLWPLRGSILSCGLTNNSFFSGKRTVYGGSRFMIAGSIEFTDELKTELLGEKENTKIEDAFIEYGGIPNASQQMTVFAQIYQGLDVAENIMSAQSDENTHQPYDEITINSIRICTYKESAETD